MKKSLFSFRNHRAKKISNSTRLIVFFLASSFVGQAQNVKLLTQPEKSKGYLGWKSNDLATHYQTNVFQKNSDGSTDQEQIIKL